MSSLRALIGILCTATVFFANTFLIAAADPPAAQLFTDSPLQPASTLEFRFARPMVGAEEVGLSPKEGPITISPPIPGNFTWLSRSSGTFTPTEPPRLGTEYTVTIRRGIKAADGKPLNGNAQWTLKTPPFERTALHNGVYDVDNIPARPSVKLAFNLAVDLASAAKLLKFVDASGRTVPAQVRHATQRDYFSLQPEQDDWNLRWQKARHPEAVKESEPEDFESETDEDTTPGDEPPPNIPRLLNRLVVTPAAPLSTGTEWQLEMKGGLTDQSGKYRIPTLLTIPLGTSKPFRVTGIEPSNYINSGRSATVQFSRDIAEDITDETASKFFRIEPPVPNLRFENGYTAFTMRGEFERGREYRLILDPGVVSREGYALEGEREFTFQFAPVAPRLYLPEITGHQIRSGRRQLEVLSANLKTLRVIARLISPEETPRAIAAFAEYNMSSEGEDQDELYKPIAPKQIGGKPIHERVIELEAQPIDSRQMTTLNWDDILGQRKAGAVFLTVEGEPRADVGGKRVGAQALIQLTDLGVLWKRVQDGLQVTVFSMATGKPVDGVQVTQLDTQFGTPARYSTDAEGTAMVKLSPEPGWLVITKGDDAHALPIGNESRELPMAAFQLPIDYAGWEKQTTASLELRGIIFTDRPLYRPGEVVRVKGILRRVGAAGLEEGSGLNGQLKLRDPQGREAAIFDVRTDDRGAFDTEVKLGTAVTGSHSLELSIPEAPEMRWQRGLNCSFQVTDFQPNAFELNVALPNRIAGKTPIKADVDAKYFFGAPVTKADVQWTLQYARESFAPDGFFDWKFGTDGASGRTLTVRGDGKLISPQPFTIVPELPAPEGAPYKGVLTVEATDLNQQTVSESKVFVRDASEFYLGVAVPDGGTIFRAGGEIAAKVIAVRPDGQPLTTPVDISAELVHVRYDTVRVQGAGNAVSFRTEKTEETVGRATGKTLIPFRQDVSWKVREGTTASFKTSAAGQYRIRVTAKDAAGNSIASELPIHVSGSTELAWDYRNPAQIELTPDKQEYRPGETAKLLVKTPISGEALVSIERGKKVLRTQRIRLNGNAPVIEVPLSASDAPNVFVNLMIIRGLEESTRKFKTAEYRYGAAMLRVVDPVARLQVDITPTRLQVQPGEEVDTEVRVRNGSGAAVGDAEVTLFAVDDGILALTGYERPAPGELFNAAFPLAIRTGISLYDTLAEDPAELEFANKGYLIGGGGLEGPGLKLRRNFPGTAAWFPNLRTDRDGKVRVKIPAPDALTRYRLVAVVHAGTNLFGAGESAFTIRKQLMLLPALGQFANVGDELVARAVIRNETGVDGTVEVHLQLDATAEPVQVGPDGLRARIPLKNGEARSVDFPVRMRAMGEAAWRWAARVESGGKTFEDQVASTLNVGSPAPVLRETYLTDLSGRETNLLAGVNPQLVEGTGGVTVTVSNTRLASLREGASQLLQYPYGCAEQTMSSLVPWLLTKELRPVLPELAKPGTEVTAVIENGLGRIFSMQTSGGGIAMWPGGNEPSMFISAYAALGCSLLASQKMAVPPGTDALLKYLSGELRGIEKIPDDTRLAERALALYALAAFGKAEPAYHEHLFRRRKELSRETRAILALAIHESAGQAKMVDELLDPRASAPESFSLFGGAARERAIQLLAYSRCRPRSPEIAKLVKELLGYQFNGHWGTTQQNAWALLGLARYYTAVEGRPKPVNGAFLADERRTPFTVNGNTPAITQAIAFSPANPLGNLAVMKEGAAPLFGETRFIVRPPAQTQPRQNRGYAVTRTYQKLADDGSLHEASDLKVGDRVLVTLQVETTRPGHFVAIDDPLPAVFEAVNPAFRSRAVGGGESLTQAAASDYEEMRADRVLYFCNHLTPGQYKFRYLARIRSAGSASAGPTKVEEMYRPERFGLGDTVKIVTQLAER